MLVDVYLRTALELGEKKNSICAALQHAGTERAYPDRPLPSTAVPGRQSSAQCSRHGLTLVHFSSEHEPSLSMKLHETNQRIPQKVLTLSREVDGCKPLARGPSSRRPSQVITKSGRQGWGEGWGVENND